MLIENLVIIGSGPAGYTAAIYAGRAQLKPIVFEGFEAGGVPGGQLMTTTDVENFPGFPAGIQGPHLMHQMRQQALRWGAKCMTDDVVDVDFSQRPFRITATEQVVYAHAVIICTGATARGQRHNGYIFLEKRDFGTMASRLVPSVMEPVLCLRVLRLRLWVGETPQ